MLSYVFALHCIIRTTHVSTYELIKMFKEGRTVPRKGHTQKRDVLADPMYNSKVVTKLINNIMLDGKTYRRSKLSGANRGKSRQKTDFSASLAYNIFPSERREDNGRKTGK